ncbi:MAG: DNA-binding protein [uncultured bacterium]|nr:MAG: DNA-binding protein [uncultured bacterium]
MVKRSLTAHQKLKQSMLRDPVARAEYEAFKLELEVAEQLKTAREKVHLSQSDVANQMQTHKPAIARLEAAGGKGKHSPTIKTLSKFATAIGFDLRVKLVQKKKRIG